MAEGSPDKLAAGRIIDSRWRVARRIGAGSMGAVYEVEHVLSGERAALKMMHPRLLADEELRRRFRQEALVTSALRCEHIVQTLDAGTDPDTNAPYLAMELLVGIDLDRRLDCFGPPRYPEALALLAQVAEALDVTHEAGIVHRDINPKNVFVTPRSDGRLVVKVLDYGVAKVVAESPTAAGTLAAGTPLYMAPEQLRGDGDIDGAADRYALGQLAFTLLTGSPFWLDEHERTKKVFQLVNAILDGPREPAKVRAARRGVALPPAFDGWFERATHRDRAARFSSAREQIEALAGALEVALSSGLRKRRARGTSLDGSACERLAGRAAEGDEMAWQQLVSTLWPFWLRSVRRNPAMGSLGKQEDHVNDVVARLVEKLSPRGGAALGTYPTWSARHPDKGFEDWLRIVTAFTVRDHVRHTLGRSKQHDPDMPSHKRLLNEFVASPSIDEVGGFRPSYTSAQLADKLLGFARERLSTDRLDALTLWLQGADYGEIAESMGHHDADEARRLLRAAIAVLRRQFTGDAAG